MTINPNNIEQQLAQLIEVTRQQGENTTQLGREQREQFELQRQQQREQFEQEMVALYELRQITERQAENIRNLTAVVGTTARSVDRLAKNSSPLLETSRRAVRASESTELLATRILDEVRELVDRLRSQE